MVYQGSPFMVRLIGPQSVGKTNLGLTNDNNLEKARTWETDPTMYTQKPFSSKTEPSIELLLNNISDEHLEHYNNYMEKRKISGIKKYSHNGKEGYLFEEYDLTLIDQPGHDYDKSKKSEKYPEGLPIYKAQVGIQQAKTAVLMYDINNLSFDKVALTKHLGRFLDTKKNDAKGTGVTPKTALLVYFNKSDLVDEEDWGDRITDVGNVLDQVLAYIDAEQGVKVGLVEPIIGSLLTWEYHGWSEINPSSNSKLDKYKILGSVGIKNALEIPQHVMNAGWLISALPDDS